MNHAKNFFYLLIGVISFLHLSSCKKKEALEKLKWSVNIVDSKGEIIKNGEAIIYVWQKDAKEPEKVIVDLSKGSYEGSLSKAEKYVINFHIKGYGLVSKVYYRDLPANLSVELKRATIISLDPSIGGVITDTQNNCPGSLSFRANWSQEPLSGVPLILNSKGDIVSFGRPADLETAYNFHALKAECNNGISVNFTPNSINTSSPVTVSMSVIDLFSPDGMPGDYTARLQNGTGYMESFGAFSLDIYDAKNKYNIKEGQEISVSFPTIKQKDDNSKDNLNVSNVSKTMPKEVPILYYDEKTGEWKKEGIAVLDENTQQYIAKVKHFSAINLDIEKVNPACARFQDSNTNADLPYQIEVTVPPTSGGNPIVRTRTVSSLCGSPNDRQFALTRLPASKFINVVFFTSVGTNLFPKGTLVFKTPASDPALVDPSQPTCDNFTLCGNYFDFNMSKFTLKDIMIAGCVEQGVNAVRFSIATTTPGFNPSIYNLLIATPDGGTCPNTNLPLSSATIISSYTGSNFTILNYNLGTCTGAATVSVSLTGSGFTTRKIAALPYCE